MLKIELEPDPELELGKELVTEKWITGPGDIELVRPKETVKIPAGKQALVKRVDKTNRDEKDWSKIKWQLFRREVLKVENAPEDEDDTIPTAPLPFVDPADVRWMEAKVPVTLAVGFGIAAVVIATIILQVFL